MRTGLFVVLVGVLALSGSTLAGEISPYLEAQLADKQDDVPLKVLVVMRDRIDIVGLDLSLHDQRVDLATRHVTVIETLKDAARSAQADLLADLAGRQNRGEALRFKAHWLINGIMVTATKPVIREIAARLDVDVIEPNFVPQLIEPVSRVEPGDRSIGITPGVVNIGARRVWNELGIRGEGALIGSNDTGVDGYHPALVDCWRGQHTQWSDAWLDVLGGATEFPSDGDGHGTHCTGTMCGLAPNDTIGVAPAAEWIASNVINQGVYDDFDADIIDCFEWFTDPDGIPQTMWDVPDVVQNSWGVNESFGYPDCDSRWWSVIDGCEAAGPVVVFAAGNEGPGAQTLRSPADRATSVYNCFSVGATNHSPPFAIAGFSSRGPAGPNCGPVQNRTKPEVSAPGVSIYSAVPGGYQYMDGTSMACPHVAGTVALMRSANPNLDVITIKQILMDTARDLGPAGDDNTYGHGFIDAYEAVASVLPLGDVRPVAFVDPQDGGSRSQYEQFTPRASFENLSLRNLYSVPVRFCIAGPAPDTTVVYDEAAVIGVLYAGGGPEAVDFPSTFIAASGEYSMSAKSMIAGDEDPANDQLDGAFSVLPYETVSIVAWGLEGYGECSVPEPNIDFVAVSASMCLSLGLKSTGSIVAFGSNVYGQCNIPEPNTDFIAVAASWGYSLGLKSSGFIVGWGDNTFGQCNAPAPNADFVAIAAASSHSLGLKSDGSIVGWGNNDYGQCNVPSPNEDFVAVAGGGSHCLGVKSDGTIVAWGRNNFGQCNVPSPNADFVAVSGGSMHSLGLRSDGTIVAWGDNNFGQCNVPAPNSDFVGIAAGFYHSLGMTAGGTIVAWGQNGFGQGAPPLPNEGFVSISAGYAHNLGLKGGTMTTVLEPPGSGNESETLRIPNVSLVPNPFNPSTTITYEVLTAGPVRLQVFDLRGRLVRTLVDDSVDAGRHEADWDGRSDDGRELPSAVYLSRLEAGGRVAMGRMTLVR